VTLARWLLPPGRSGQRRPGVVAGTAFGRLPCPAASPIAKQATTFGIGDADGLRAPMGAPKACSLHASAAGSGAGGRAATCRPREAPPGNWRGFFVLGAKLSKRLFERAQLFRDLPVAAENCRLAEFTRPGVTRTCDGNGAGLRRSHGGGQALGCDLRPRFMGPSGYHPAVPVVIERYGSKIRII
jgi:hypothetical protein